MVWAGIVRKSAGCWKTSVRLSFLSVRPAWKTSRHYRKFAAAAFRPRSWWIGTALAVVCKQEPPVPVDLKLPANFITVPRLNRACIITSPGLLCV